MEGFVIWAGLHLTQHFSFLGLLGYSRHFFISATWSTFSYISLLCLCCKHNLLQSTVSCLFWAGPIFVPMYMTTSLVVLCHSKWHVECLPFSNPLILFFSIFPSHTASASVTVSVAAQSSFLAISSSWCVHHYRCYTWQLGLSFSGFWVTYIL